MTSSPTSKKNNEPILMVKESPISSLEDGAEGRRDIAKRVAKMLMRHTELPNVFGIYGNWGSGKSTLADGIKKIIDTEYEDSLTVNFEPWKYEYAKENDLLFALLRKIEKDIELPEDGAWKEAAKDLMTVGLWMVGEKVGLDPSKLEEWNKTLWSEYQGWVDSVELFRKEFSNVIAKTLVAKGKQKLVIFIDDLDRCLPENTVRLLESLKNFLSVEKTLFVISIDRRVVSEMIEKKYGLHEGYGREYLMKIIPYFTELKRFNLKSIIEDILVKYQIPNHEELIEGIQHVLGLFAPEPRRAKHLLNQFCMRVLLAKEGLRETMNRPRIYTSKPPARLQVFVVSTMEVLFPVFFEGHIKDRLEVLNQIYDLSPRPDAASQQKCESLMLRLNWMSREDIEQLALLMALGYRDQKLGKLEPDEIYDIYQDFMN